MINEAGRGVIHTDEAEEIIHELAHHAAENTGGFRALYASESLRGDQGGDPAVGEER